MVRGDMGHEIKTYWDMCGSALLGQDCRQWLESQPELRPLLEFEAAAVGIAIGEIQEPEHMS